MIKLLEITCQSRAVCSLSINVMSCKKMTVSVVSVLFLLAVSLSVDKVSENLYVLDMANDSVDDSYEGCREAMNTSVISNFSEYEMNNTPNFKEAWNRALLHHVKGELGKNQSTAINLYTRPGDGNNPAMHSVLNLATRKGGQNYTSGHFQFYTFHFFLTDAINQLKQSQPGCRTTYRRTNRTFQIDDRNQTVRFGFFASSSLVKTLTGFGEKSCFEIYTCLGAELGKYSPMQNEKEVLIPPYEVFNVTAIRRRIEDEHLWCEVVYELKHAANQSNLKCHHFTTNPPKCMCKADSSSMVAQSVNYTSRI
ncbi:T-cell ecto-ADP-ribosyltransferase 1-like [Salminus brasiliensis]|uniref:T-cell ecto-ADP-ribosyltransferase 1-like n=1 Tax=Salminus brasiliensis TaxID=930266 RepID=UPI003B8327D6